VSKDLIARLEVTEVGSRELDRDIEIAIGGGWIGADEQRVYRRDKNGFGYTQAFSTVTTSLDAALALAERVLDGDFSYDLFHDFGGFNRAKVHGITDGPISGEGRAETMPLALCVAVLKAKAQP